MGIFDVFKGKSDMEKSKNKSNIFAQKRKRKHAIICNIFH